MLTFLAGAVTDPPDCLVIEEQRLDDDLCGIAPSVMPHEIRHFVSEDCFEFRRAQTGCQPRREHDDWPNEPSQHRPRGVVGFEQTHCAVQSEALRHSNAQALPLGARVVAVPAQRAHPPAIRLNAVTSSIEARGPSTRKPTARIAGASPAMNAAKVRRLGQGTRRRMSVEVLRRSPKLEQAALRQRWLAWGWKLWRLLAERLPRGAAMCFAP